MGDVIPFRGERRWTRPEDYGFPPEPPDDGPRRPQKKPKRGKSRRPRAWLFWLVSFVGIGLWVGSDPALIMEPPSWLASEPETVDGTFTRCGPGRGENCVIDGDTFKIGERKIRIIGIDAPETHPARCDAEAQMGEKATAELQRLLNQGPFTIVGRIDDPVDKYGRELRAVKRVKSDGTTQLIARELIDSGMVRAYRGNFRRSWCNG